jgi:hypothetical protein
MQSPSSAPSSSCSTPRDFLIVFPISDSSTTRSQNYVIFRWIMSTQSNYTLGYNTSVVVNHGHYFFLVMWRIVTWCIYALRKLGCACISRLHKFPSVNRMEAELDVAFHFWKFEDHIYKFQKKIKRMFGCSQWCVPQACKILYILRYTRIYNPTNL